MALNSCASQPGSLSDCFASRIRFGTCEILPHTREVFVGGQACPVEPKVFDLVLYLIMGRGRVISKNELLEHIWKGVFVSESVLARTIMKARKAIGDQMPGCPFIKTIHCVGYRFVPAVEICHDSEPQAAGSVNLEHLPRSAKAYIQEDRII